MSDETEGGEPTGYDPLEPAGGGKWEVEAGDSIASIAFETGFFPDTLWNHGDNAALKEARTKPEELLPGDKVAVPDLREKIETRATGAVHKFRRKGVPLKISFVAEDEDGKPFAGKNYELTIGGQRYTGQTDGEGKIEKSVLPDKKTGTLKVFVQEPGYPEVVKYPLFLGGLAPVRSLAGVQQRLRNLDYYDGSCSGNKNQKTVEAVKAFQKSEGLDVTGDIDDAFRDKLRAVHRS